MSFNQENYKERKFTERLYIVRLSLETKKKQSINGIGLNKF